MELKVFQSKNFPSGTAKTLILNGIERSWALFKYSSDEGKLILNGIESTRLPSFVKLQITLILNGIERA